MMGIGATAQTLAGKPKAALQDGEAFHERGPTRQNGSTRMRPKAAGNVKKHPMHTGAAETKQHTAPKSPHREGE